MPLPTTEKLAALLVDGTFTNRCLLIIQDLAESVLENGKGGLSDAVWAKRSALCLDVLQGRVNPRLIIQSLLMEDTVRGLVAAVADAAGVAGWRAAVDDAALRTALTSRLVRYANLRT